MSERVPLAELAAVNPPAPRTTRGEPVAFIAMEDLSEEGRIERQRVEKSRPGYTAFVPGDVLVAKITPCFENGKGAHVRGLCLPTGQGSTEFHVLRAGPGVDSRFLYHHTRTARFRLAGAALMTGSAGQRRVPAELFRRYEIWRPCHAEQRRIAEILDTIDNAIARSDRLSQKLRDVRQGAVEAELARIRRFPEEVLERQLLRIEAGKSPDVPDVQPGPGAWGVLKVSAVQPDGFRPTEAKELTRPQQVRKQDRVRTGDVLMTRANTTALVGLCSIVREDPGLVQLSDKTLRLIPDVHRADPEFLALLLQSSAGRSQIEALGTGTSGSMKNISQLEIRSLRFPWPTIDVQRGIVTSANAHDRRFAAELAVGKKLRALRERLADDLLDGEVRTEMR